MEYGLWNLPSGFWPAASQGNMPLDSMGRPYYAPANGLPPAAFHGNMNEGDTAHFPMAHTPGYREYLASAKNGSAHRPVADQEEQKSQHEAMLALTAENSQQRPLEGYANNSMADHVMSTSSGNDVKDDKVVIKTSSPSFAGHDEPNGQQHIKNNPTIDYLKQQSYQHPMYGMLFSQMATNPPMNAPASDTEEEEKPIHREPDDDANIFSDESQSGPCRSPSSADVQHTNAGFECGECGLVAETRPFLKKHIAHSHPDSQGAEGNSNKMASQNACPVPSCRFRTNERAEMEAHISRHVSEGLNTNGKKKACPVALQRVRYEREEYRCQMCAYSCTIEKAYYKHLKVHTIGMQGASPIKISCVICGKDRTSEVDMNKHMKKHRDDRYFCCDICIFKTVQLKKLIQHRRMHTGEKPHLCPHCSYRSARRDNLRSHVRRVHKKENLYCDTFSPRELLISASTMSPTNDNSQMLPPSQDGQEV